MNSAYLNVLILITTHLKVFSELTIQLSSLKNKKYIPNNTHRIIGVKQKEYIRIFSDDSYRSTIIYDLLNEGYTFEGYTVEELITDKYKVQEYYYNSQKHRNHLPAVIWYQHYGDHNYHLSYEEYFEHGECHRIGKPAIIYYELINDVITITYEGYYEHGEEIIK